MQKDHVATTLYENFELLWAVVVTTFGHRHAHIVRIIITHIYNKAKTMSAIVLELRPKFQELRAKDYYSHEEVLDILCEFAKSLYPQIAPERIREIVTENF